MTNGTVLFAWQLGDLGTVAHMDGSMEITEGDNRYLSRYVHQTSRRLLLGGVRGLTNCTLRNC